MSAPDRAHRQLPDRFEKPARRIAVTPAKVRRRALRLGKALYQRLAYPVGTSKRAVLIFGCQRSGTDLVTHILDEDWSSRVYAETSVMSSRDAPRRLRLDPLPEVARRISRQRAPLIVLKPLVESQHARRLLDCIPGSRALWLYRDYRAVALSRVRKHGHQGAANQIWDLRAIVERKSGDWRYENVTEELRDTVVRHFDYDMDGLDAAALFWYVRNSLFFVQGLERDPRVMACRYEDLVVRPQEVIESIYAFLGRPAPGGAAVRGVDPRPLAHGRELTLSPEVDSLCRELLGRLDASRWSDRSSVEPSPAGGHPWEP